MNAVQVKTCPLCESDRTVPYAHAIQDYLTEDAFGIQRCTVCGLAFTSPQPLSMDRYYPRRYRRFSRLGTAVLRVLYRRRAAAWIGAYGRSGKVLEIGTGAGWMLQALRRAGWTVVGNERIAQGAAAVLPKQGIPIFVGGLDALRPRPHFDLIILFQVLEHLPNPLEVLRQCSGLLKPGGTLVVAVPNLASWQARLFGPAWFHLDVPRHLFHFTPQSLERALRGAALEVRKVGHRSLEHDPYGWIQSTLNLAGFRQNHLTRLLMGIDRWRRAPLAGVGMMIFAGMLLVPSVVLAVVSWMARAGALIEMSAVKTPGLPGGRQSSPMPGPT